MSDDGVATGLPEPWVSVEITILATTYSCPVPSLPRLVQAKLSVCPT